MTRGNPSPPLIGCAQRPNRCGRKQLPDLNFTLFFAQSSTVCRSRTARDLSAIGILGDCHGKGTIGRRKTARPVSLVLVCSRILRRVVLLMGLDPETPIFDGRCHSIFATQAGKDWLIHHIHKASCQVAPSYREAEMLPAILFRSSYAWTTSPFLGDEWERWHSA